MTEFLWKEVSKDKFIKWDELIKRSHNGTIFHERKFLSYHGKKFKNEEKYLSCHKGESTVALLSLTISLEKNFKTAKSPYGGSYGGVIFVKNPTYQYSTNIIYSLKEWLKKNKIKKITLTSPPDIFFEGGYSGTQNFCFLEQGFLLENRDVSSVVNLQSRKLKVTMRAKNMIQKAKKNGVEICYNSGLESFWPILLENYKKFSAKPTHSMIELQKLLVLYPKSIQITTAKLGKKTVAGVVEIKCNRFVQSSFYLCQTSEGRKKQALSLLIFNRLEIAKKNHFKFYDFGTSTDGKMKARENVFLFKESFGSIGVLRETLKLELK